MRSFSQYSILGVQTASSLRQIHQLRRGLRPPPQLMGFPEGGDRLDPHKFGFESNFSMGWVPARGPPKEFVFRYSHVLHSVRLSGLPRSGCTAQPSHAVCCEATGKSGDALPWPAVHPDRRVAVLWEGTFNVLRIGNWSFWGSGRPRGPGRPFQKVGGEAPHFLEGSPGPPGSPRPPK